MSPRGICLLVVGLATGCLACRAPREAEVLNAVDVGRRTAIPELADTLARLAANLPPCSFAPAPAEWPRVVLKVADGSIRSPPWVLAEPDEVPNAAEFQSWSSRGDNVVLIASRDSVASGGLAGRRGQCALRVGGRSTPLWTSAHRARPDSRDSVYVGEVDAAVTSTLWLHAQVSTRQRQRLDTLLSVLGSLEITTGR